MALQNSPPISILEICNEFLAPAGTPISSFYRGGPYVPNIAQNAAVPTAGQISLLQFLGATRYAPYSLSVGQSGGYVFQAEPAPISRSVSGSLIASATGGTGSYSSSWAYVSGSPPGFTWSQSAGGFAVNCTGNVAKNSVANVVFQLTFSDGVTVSVTNRTLRLEYQTDL